MNRRDLFARLLAGAAAALGLGAAKAAPAAPVPKATPAGPPVVFGHSYSVTTVYGAGPVRRRAEGWLDASRVGDPRPLLPAVPPGWRRVASQYHIDRHGKTLRYEVTDEEAYRKPA